MSDDVSIEDLRAAVADLKTAVQHVRDMGQRSIPTPGITLPQEATGWNFSTFEKYINQRFTDFAINLRERYEAQQTGVTAALAAAEKAVNAALIAAEKAVDKAEGAQQLRNEAQNEFRQSLSDLSALMWTAKEGVATVDGLRREFSLTQGTLVERIGLLENNYSNLQGRMWAISALWALAALGLSVAVRFFH
jgi:hypothetical protein